jgi:hypothetical protein
MIDGIIDLEEKRGIKILLRVQVTRFGNSCGVLKSPVKSRFLDGESYMV